MFLQQLGHCVHRSQAHLPRVYAGPGMSDDFTHHRQVMPFYRRFTGEHKHSGAIGNLRAIAGGNRTVITIECWLEFGKFVEGRISTQTGVFKIVFATGIIKRCYLSLHMIVIECRR